MTHQLWGFVRPRYDHINVWRVIEVDATRNEITAERRPRRLGENCPRCTASSDFFVSLEEEKD
ncbi:hypothetical protein QUB63_02295 [Microcoleus sp. ARI1-B5]|uniref:hypothetical protein n=1 Tax=unclassified Microcoleus TaxID=2642155 RepID=UPI002FD14253